MSYKTPTLLRCLASYGKVLLVAPTLRSLYSLEGGASVGEQNHEYAADEGKFRVGPFVALGPLRSYVVVTNGGLKVTLAHEVVGGDGNPVHGLFAAGLTGQGGLLLEDHGPHLAWALISGRRAGRNAALGGAAQ